MGEPHFLQKGRCCHCCRGSCNILDQEKTNSQLHCNNKCTTESVKETASCPIDKYSSTFGVFGIAHPESVHSQCTSNAASNGNAYFKRKCNCNRFVCDFERNRLHSGFCRREERQDDKRGFSDTSFCERNKQAPEYCLKSRSLTNQLDQGNKHTTYPRRESSSQREHCLKWKNENCNGATKRASKITEKIKYFSNLSTGKNKCDIRENQAKWHDKDNGVGNTAFRNNDFSVSSSFSHSQTKIAASPLRPFPRDGFSELQRPCRHDCAIRAKGECPNNIPLKGDGYVRNGECHPQSWASTHDFSQDSDWDHSKRAFREKHCNCCPRRRDQDVKDKKQYHSLSYALPEAQFSSESIKSYSTDMEDNRINGAALTRRELPIENPCRICSKIASQKSANTKPEIPVSSFLKAAFPCYIPDSSKKAQTFPSCALSGRTSSKICGGERSAKRDAQMKISDQPPEACETSCNTLNRPSFPRFTVAKDFGVNLTPPYSTRGDHGYKDELVKRPIDQYSALHEDGQGAENDNPPGMKCTPIAGCQAKHRILQDFNIGHKGRTECFASPAIRCTHVGNINFGGLHENEYDNNEDHPAGLKCKPIGDGLRRDWNSEINENGPLQNNINLPGEGENCNCDRLALLNHLDRFGCLSSPKIVERITLKPPSNYTLPLRDPGVTGPYYQEIPGQPSNAKENRCCTVSPDNLSVTHENCCPSVVKMSQVNVAPVPVDLVLNKIT